MLQECLTMVPYTYVRKSLFACGQNIHLAVLYIALFYSFLLSMETLKWCTQLLIWACCSNKSFFQCQKSKCLWLYGSTKTFPNVCHSSGPPINSLVLIFGRVTWVIELLVWFDLTSSFDFSTNFDIFRIYKKCCLGTLALLLYLVWSLLMLLETIDISCKLLERRSCIAVSSVIIRCSTVIYL